ncbi:MAG: hypothetical protein GC181_08585 [Bacteroidetes bacterium]|nr:hypothetical protein [Bacteroidota bacterium]
MIFITNNGYASDTLSYSDKSQLEQYKVNRFFMLKDFPLLESWNRFAAVITDQNTDSFAILINEFKQCSGFIKSEVGNRTNYWFSKSNYPMRFYMSPDFRMETEKLKNGTLCIFYYIMSYAHHEKDTDKRSKQKVESVSSSEELILDMGSALCRTRFGTPMFATFNYGQTDKVYSILAEQLRFEGVHIISEVHSMHTVEDSTVWSIKNYEFITDTNLLVRNYLKTSSTKQSVNLDWLNNNHTSVESEVQMFFEDDHMVRMKNSFGNFTRHKLCEEAHPPFLLFEKTVDSNPGISNLIFRENYSNTFTRTEISFPSVNIPDSTNQNNCLELLDYLNLLSRNKSIKPDTTYYTFDYLGGLISIVRNRAISPDLLPFQLLYAMKSNDELHPKPNPPANTQLYVNGITMKDFIKSVCGFTPQILVLEVYENGCLTFALDQQSQKYFSVGSIFIEE